MATKKAPGAPVPQDVSDALVKQQAESTLKQRLSNQAMILLREKHRSEYDSIAGQLYKDNGLAYARRKTPQEIVQEKIEALAGSVGAVVKITWEDDQNTDDPGYVTED